jgi:hypothetical protein
MDFENGSGAVWSPQLLDIPPSELAVDASPPAAASSLPDPPTVALPLAAPVLGPVESPEDPLVLALAPEDEVLSPEDEPEFPPCPPELGPCPDAPDGDGEPPLVEQPAAMSAATKIAARLETRRERAVRFEDMLPVMLCPEPR